MPFYLPGNGNGNSEPAVAVTKFADLEDVDISEMPPNGSAARFMASTQKWVAGPVSETDAMNFRGDWQNASDALLWSTDFSNLVNFQQQFSVEKTGTYGSALFEPTLANSFLADPPSTWALHMYLQIASGSKTAYVSGTLDLDTLIRPDTYVNRIEYTSSLTYVNGNAGTLLSRHFGVNEVDVAQLPSESWQSLGSWAERVTTLETTVNRLRMRFGYTSRSTDQ